jgi:hypothetical protein
MSFQDETKARRILDRWRGASKAHIRSDLQRTSNEARGPKDKRISLILKAIWNKALGIGIEKARSSPPFGQGNVILFS